MNKPAWKPWGALLKAEWQHLSTFNRSDRRWQMPLCAALASGLPLLISAYLDHLTFGLTASLGGLIFLYTPSTALHHRMVTLMACAFGMCACYTLGIVVHFVPWLRIPVIVFVAALVTMACRFYAVGPPGSMFFVMATSIGMYSPVQALEVPLHVGLLTMGCLLACLVALFYSAHVLRLQPAQPVKSPDAMDTDLVVFEPLVISVFVGLSLALAEGMGLDRAYWVPVSCLAVIQGGSLRAVWIKQVHRIGGTAMGLGVAWALLALPLDPWRFCALMITLTFIVETLVVRHYGLAAVFITPMTILLAEASQLGHMDATGILHARLADTVLGSAIGLLGGGCLHHPGFRLALAPKLRQWMPDNGKP